MKIAQSQRHLRSLTDYINDLKTLYIILMNNMRSWWTFDT